MTTAQIQSFLEVAQCESFTKAAQKLFISHQALSSHIKALEKELGLTLLDRSNKRKVILTDAGRIMFDAWTQARRIEAQAMEDAKRIQEAQTRSIIIGIQDMKFVRSYVVPMIRGIQNEKEPYMVEYRLGYPEELINMLEDGTIDMLLMISSDLHHPEKYHTTVVRDSQLHPVIAISKNHPLAKKKKFRIQDLNGQTVLMVGSGYSKEAVRRFKKDMSYYGFVPGKIKTFHGPRAINIALETEGGIAVIFEELLEENTDNLKLIPITLADENEEIQMMLAWKKDELTKAAQKMSQY